MDERSPVKQAGCIKQPLLILHGDRDTPPRHVIRIRDAVQEAGVTCILVVFKGDSHGLNLSRHEMFERMFAFLETHCE